MSGSVAFESHPTLCCCDDDDNMMMMIMMQVRAELMSFDLFAFSAVTGCGVQRYFDATLFGQTLIVGCRS